MVVEDSVEMSRILSPTVNGSYPLSTQVTITLLSNLCLVPDSYQSQRLGG
jgi:hypothetical protein